MNSGSHYQSTQHPKEITGKVTKAERKKLPHTQNKASKDIYKQKHDAQAAK